MSQDTKELVEKTGKAVEELKGKIEGYHKDAVTKDSVNKIIEDITKTQEIVQNIEKENVALKAQIQFLGGNNVNGENQEIEQKSKDAICEYLRKGDSLDLEKKSMLSGDGANGGYLVPKLMSSKIIKRIFETSNIRALASVESVSSSQLEFLIDDNEANAGWTSETGPITETGTPAIGKKIIAVHGLFAEPRASQNLIDDSEVDVESWLINKVVEKISRMENTAFVNGNGTGKPRGFLTYDNVATAGTYEREKIEQIALGGVNDVTSNGLIELQNSLKEDYNSNSVWAMRRSTFGNVLKLVNTDDKQMSITPDVSNGSLLLLGKRVNFMDDMPEVASNALSIAYGDFGRAYQILDRAGIRVLRDNYTSKPFVKFYTTKRVGGDVLNFEAIKLGKIATSV